MNKLNRKIFWILVTILFVTVGSNNLLSGLFFNHEYGKAVEKEIFHIGDGLKQQLERIMSLGLNLEEVYEFNEICKEVADKYPEAAYALVFNKKAELAFHSEGQEPQSIEINELEYESALSQRQGTVLDIGINGKSYTASLIPVMKDGNEVQGAVVVPISDGYITSKTKRLVYYSLLQSVLFYLISLVLLGTILYRWVTKPLNGIVHAMEEAGSGDLDVRVEVNSRDEFRTLANGLNDMLVKVKELMKTREEATQIQMKYVSEQERSRVSELLRLSMYTVSSTLDVDKVENLTLYHLKHFVSYSRATLWVEAEGGLRQKASCANDPTYAVDVKSDVVGKYYAQMIQSGKHILSELDDIGVYIMVIPLKLHDHFIGAVVMEKKDGPFGQDEADLALTYTSQAIIAMDNALIYRKMEKMAITDELTGMYNRRHIFQITEQEVMVAQKHHTALSVILFDIDHFKKINDKYGHFIGDDVLRRLASIVNEVISVKHMAARFGGEEFVILLPTIQEREARGIAENIRRKIFEYEFSANGEPFNVTVSLGVTSLIDKDHMDTFLQRADEALYVAKEKGRNCVYYKKV